MNKRHIHIDLVGGLAGDMFLAAAIDAGLVEPHEAQEVLQKVGLGPVEVIIERVVRGAIEGTHIRFEGWDESKNADHRHLSTIRTMLGESDLDEGVRERALEMFDILGRAESEVHGIPMERVHFHEVGAVDSILDFVAAAWIIEKVQATWSMGEIPVGTGTIETAHGTIPVPAPATARVLEGQKVVYRDVENEFVTPTGATILATVADLIGPRRGRIATSGFGCGTREVEGISNVVRLVVLAQDEQKTGAERDEVIRLVCEIDDQSPEILAYAGQKLMDLGALDVVREAVQMKKGRLGTRLNVLCAAEKEEELVEAIFSETTTLGIRREKLERWTLRRSTRRVETSFGSVGVKIAWWKGEVLKISPEFEDCAALATEANVPVRAVFEAARRVAESQKN